MVMLRRKALLKTNLELWLNDKLLRDGLYTNVSTAETNIYGADISLLVPVNDEDFSDGRVWQSAFKNWVYEPGIPSPSSGVAPPMVSSGVTVNGTFYSDTAVSGVFTHYIDYVNGRIVFDSPVSSLSIVQGQFAYKEVMIDHADKLDNENEPLQIETTYKDNPEQTGVETYPSKKSRTLPAVWIDITGRNNDGYELGSKSLVSDFLGVFHIWGRDSYLRDIIEDILSDTHRDVLLGIDFNTAEFPLLSRGRKNSNWPGYAAQANVYSKDFWRRIYLDNIDARKDTSLFEIERTRVGFLARIYPNF